MIKIEGIKKRFGKREILSDASVEIKEGEIIGLIGSNGSGKSTFLSILAGIMTPNAGEFSYDGADLFKDASAREKTVGYVPQGTPLIEELSARDNLLLWYTKEEMEKSLKDGILKKLGVDRFTSKRVGNISGGMKKRLSIGCALSSSPKLILLDEPTAALDIPCKNDIMSYIKSFTEGGGSCMIATHDINEIAMCDRLYLLKGGKTELFDYGGDIEKLTEILR